MIDSGLITSQQSRQNAPVTKPRRRTRIDSFQLEWNGITELLEEKENLSATDILDLLIIEYPEDFNWSHLRTLQRRIKSWRSKRTTPPAQG